MTAILTLVWAASKALMLEEPASPPITNPLPVMKGQIGKSKPARAGSAPVSGYAPLNPASLPGVLFAIKDAPVPKAPVIQSKPEQQGTNTAFNRALDALFAKGAPLVRSSHQLASLAPNESKAKPAQEKPAPKPAPRCEGQEKQSPPPLLSKLPSASPTKEVRTSPGTSENRRMTETAKPKIPKQELLNVALPELPKSSSGASSITKSLASRASASSEASVDSKSKLITIDVVDLELSKVIQSLSDQTGTNLILLSQTSKTLTIRLTKVSLENALSHICAVSGMHHLVIGSTFVVAPPEELKKAYPKEYEAAYPSPVVIPQGPDQTQVGPPVDPKLDTVEVVNLAYVTASEVVNILKAAFDEKELISRAGPSQHVPSLMTAETQNVTGVSTGILKNEGQDQGSGSESSGSSTSRVVVIRGTKDSVEAAKKLALQLDVPRPQIAIAVRILDISEEVMKDLGLTWTFGDQTLTERGGDGIGFRTFDRTAGAILARLSSLKKDDQAQILAEPNISVLDNQKAFILIGQRLNFPTLVGYTQANTPIFSPKEEKVGIYLQVSASVSPSNEITMSLYPQVSTVTGFLEVSGASYPQIATREAQTSLRVRSGDSIVLGGLIREEEIRNVQKVPLLADIPILGEFFKKVKTQKTKSQIIITITPTVTAPNAR